MRTRHSISLITGIFILLVGSPSLIYGADWYDSDWDYAKKITIDSTQVDSTLSDFPLLVNYTSTDVGANAQSDCDDILFTDSTNATKYSHEIENCDLTANDWFTAWIKIPSISSTVDTDLFMYYGNSTVASQENVTDTWSNNFSAVWHLHDDFLDSTSNNNDGTNNGSTDVAGHIADAQDFDGINDNITVGSGASIDNIFDGGGTVTAIVNSDGATNTESIVWSRSASFSGMAVAIRDHASGASDLRVIRDFNTTDGIWDSTSRIITDDTTMILAVTYDSSSASNNPEMWYDATNITVGSGITETLTPAGSRSSDASNTKYIGNDDTDAREWNGMLDEIRLATVIRSDAWINAEYDNWKSGSTFLTIGAQGTEATGPAISVSDGAIIGDSISASIAQGVSVSDGAIIGDSIASQLNTTHDVDVSDGAIIGDSVGTVVTTTVEKAVSDGLIIGDSVGTVVNFFLTLDVSDGLIIGDSLVVDLNQLIEKDISDGLIIGDSIEAIIFGDIPLGVSDGLVIGDSIVVVFDCDVTCSIDVSDGLIIGDTVIDTQVTIATFNSIKLYVNSPASDRLGGVFSQSCSSGFYVSGIDTTGAIICTVLP